MKTVFVGLSGGVDSAVSAALLQEQGHTVVGCFIKIWQPEFIECSWREDRLDAMRVCAALEIPFKEIDLSEEYKNEVIQPMILGYARGITPNPDVLCNKKIKFGSFARWAFQEGADMIATGHYARSERRGSEHVLLRGVDTDKDQSYFLWQLGSLDLSRTLFPVGGLTKKHVRTLAERLCLPVARKHDSQGLCFVGDITLSDFLAHYIPLKKGHVLNESGDIVGEHKGAVLYTRGQRHGFSHASGDSGAPHYVIKTGANNTITISPNSARAASESIVVREGTWIGEEPSFPLSAHVQVRYRERAGATTTKKERGNYRVQFAEPRIVASGQSLVWYEGNRVLGGGICDVEAV